MPFSFISISGIRDAGWEISPSRLFRRIRDDGVMRARHEVIMMRVVRVSVVRVREVFVKEIRGFLE